MLLPISVPQLPEVTDLRNHRVAVRLPGEYELDVAPVISSQDKLSVELCHW